LKPERAELSAQPIEGKRIIDDEQQWIEKYRLPR
jgi:hypothetical protein